MELLAPAKLNLFLNVGSKRDDGFHEFQSVMTKVSLYDRITVTESDDITVKCPGGPEQEENIAWKAAALLRDSLAPGKGCSITIEKTIPTGGGLGGGSSDAASVLTALNSIWGINAGIKQLEEIGSRLGSDVNFFLHPGGCLAEGRGEIINPLPLNRGPIKNILIAAPGIEVSTGKIYAKYRPGRLTAHGELDKIIYDYRTGRWSSILRNDLEETVFADYPSLKDIRESLAEWGTEPLLSGSGSCLFAVTENREHAEIASGRLQALYGCKSWIADEII